MQPGVARDVLKMICIESCLSGFKIKGQTHRADFMTRQTLTATLYAPFQPLAPVSWSGQGKVREEKPKADFAKNDINLA